MNANFFATFILATYPLFVVVLFLTCRRAVVATTAALLISEMVLPPGYTLPLSSPVWLGKDVIPNISCLLCAVLFGRGALRRAKPFRGLEFFFLLAVIGDFFTVATNRDPIQYGANVLLPGEKLTDVFSESIRLLAEAWIPFFLGRTLFRSSRDLVTLARMLAIAAIVYTLPIMIELRLSPLFNIWVYGYGTFREFNMAIRWGGYRPQVLMGNGIVMSMFMLACTVMTIALARVKKRVGRLPMVPLCIYLLVILVLCKSTGSIVYAFLLLPLLTLASPRRMLLFAAILCSFVLIYPLLRFGNVLPIEKVGSLFTSLSPDRAESLQYRFDMEQRFLDLTRTRPWFGMGGYGRNFVYDRQTGRADTVVDGAVIATLSSRGLVGFLTHFSPLVMTVILARRRGKKLRQRTNRLLLASLAVICAVILFDQIINAVQPPVFTLMLGALYGLAPGLLAEEKNETRGMPTGRAAYPHDQAVSPGFPGPPAFESDPRPP